MCEQDYRDELGFTDVLVAVVTIRYVAPPRLVATKGTSQTSRRPASSRRPAPTASDPRRTRRVLRVAFFSETDPFLIPLRDLVSSTLHPWISSHVRPGVIFTSDGKRQDTLCWLVALRCAFSFRFRVDAAVENPSYASVAAGPAASGPYGDRCPRSRVATDFTRYRGSSRALSPGQDEFCRPSIGISWPI